MRYDLKRELEKLEIDPFLIDLIIKFYPATIKRFFLNKKEVNDAKTTDKS